MRPDRPTATLIEVATRRIKGSADSGNAGSGSAAGDSADERVDLPFEQAMSRLSTIVDELESGQLSLEESLVRFEEGIGLARASQKKLDEAEAKVELLLSVSEDGTPLTEEIEDA